jgi:hypothetical protein
MEDAGVNEDNIVLAAMMHVRLLICCAKNDIMAIDYRQMFTFCSDSPSVMEKLQRDCLHLNEFVFIFGVFRMQYIMYAWISSSSFLE